MADHLGGDALADLALGQWIERQGEIGMGLDVDEARRDDETGGVDHARGIGPRCLRADGGDAVADDRDIGADRLGAGPVDHLAAADEDVAGCAQAAASAAMRSLNRRRMARGGASTLMSMPGASGIASLTRCCASMTAMSSPKTRRKSSTTRRVIS